MSHLPLVLASTSRYRRALLERLSIPFEVIHPDVDEQRLPEESPVEMVKRLAEAKARAVASHYPAAWIIGCDQTAALGDLILGKPGNHANAVEQLNLLSNKTIYYYNGLCLYNSEKDTAYIRMIPYEVVFRTLTPTTIEHYLHKEKPYDCAGSLKSETSGIALCHRMRGDDPTALMGLPLIALTDLLVEAGLSPL